MLVKLHDYNKDEKIDRKYAYKAPNGFYYSSVQAYTETIEREAMRKKCIDYMHDLLNYQDFMKIPSIFYKKLKDWGLYGYKVVYSAMTLSEKSIRQAIINKNFDNEYNKVSYISAIIQNNLNDALKIETNKKKITSDLPKIETDDIDNIGRQPKKAKSVADLLGGV